MRYTIVIVLGLAALFSCLVTAKPASAAPAAMAADKPKPEVADRLANANAAMAAYRAAVATLAALAALPVEAKAAFEDFEVELAQAAQAVVQARKAALKALIAAANTPEGDF